MRFHNNQLYQTDIARSAGINVPWGKLNNKSVLITGATGMIGTAIIDVFMWKNKIAGGSIKVFAMGRSREKAMNRFSSYWDNPDFTFVEHNINEPFWGWREENHIQVLELVQKADYIIHAASATHPRAYAAEPVETITANIMGLYHLLDCAKGGKLKRAVFLSSVEIYGENRGDTEKFSEEYCGYIDCNTLRAGYTESKRAGEALCQAYAKQFQMDIVIPRISRVYGPTMLESDSKAVAQFIQKAVNQENIVLKSDGSQYYSYCYVTDAVTGVLTALLLGSSGQAYNISDRKSEFTLRKIAEILAEKAGTEVVFELPDELEKAGYSKSTTAVLDANLLEHLGWKPAVHMEEGLQRTFSILNMEKIKNEEREY